MRFLKSTLAFLTAASMAACSPANPSTDAGADASGDTGMCTEVDGRICAPPTTNLCAMEGCNFRPVSLPKCDGTGNYDFYNNEFQQADLTLIVVAAGWCVPCQMEAPQVEQYITQGYNGRVRVLTVYGQNPDGSTPTPSNCNNWKNTYDLSSQMLMDTTGATQIYFPDMAFPANILVNKRGQIVYRKYGTSAGLQDLRNAIDGYLGL